MEFDEALEELCAFTGLPPEEALARIDGAYEQQVAEWRGRPRVSEEEVVEFYRQTDSYLFELVGFNYRHEAYQVWRRLIFDAVRGRCDGPGPLRVLDYGGGIGSVLLDLAVLPNLTLAFADIPGKTFDFAAWRLRRRGIPVRFIDASAPDALDGQAYDVVICLEVIDHVGDSLGLAAYLADHVVAGGVLIASCNFNNNGGDAAFHLNCDRLTSEDAYAAIAARGLRYDNSVMPRFFHKPPMERVE